MRRLPSLRRRLAAEEGYSVIELLTVLAILGTVLGALTGLFVSASRAELDLNQRFEAQQNARLALTKLRRDAHCARKASVVLADPAATTGSTVVLELPVACKASGPVGSGQVSWCAVAVGSARYALFRNPAAVCDASGVKWADYLTSDQLFAVAASVSGSLARLRVDLPVDVRPGDGRAAYRLQDTLTLRNSPRA